MWYCWLSSRWASNWKVGSSQRGMCLDGHFNTNPPPTAKLPESCICSHYMPKVMCWYVWLLFVAPQSHMVNLGPECPILFLQSLALTPNKHTWTSETSKQVCWNRMKLNSAGGDFPGLDIPDLGYNDSFYWPNFWVYSHANPAQDRLCICPGDVSDRCSCEPSWWPTYIGGLLVEPGQEAPDSWGEDSVLYCEYTLPTWFSYDDWNYIRNTQTSKMTMRLTVIFGESHSDFSDHWLIDWVLSHVP